MTGLTDAELESLRSSLGRDPEPAEAAIVAAEWSEHCSYKSSRMHLGVLPRGGPHAVAGGHDSGVLDVGGGYVATVHIESHNHPSAVEPYGGAATGVGGVIRDILSTGTRPIALLDSLRFGDIAADSHARWLFRSAVSGIADYGNCIGVPTVGGEAGFDACYARYALVGVAAVGFGKSDALVPPRAEPGDMIMLMGGPTGLDGVGGSQFASENVSGEDRSAVQIPDPFMEKLLIEAVIEARRARLFRALKDLGGGGLACAASETADSLGVGMDIDVSRVHTRDPSMSAEQVMTSESQERMLAIVSAESAAPLREICAKYRVPCSHIGTVTSGAELRITDAGRSVASMPAPVVAHAPLLDRDARRPAYLEGLAESEPPALESASELSEALASLLASPGIASKRWVYGQYDHEVGIRTVVRPGADAALLRLDNGRFLSVVLDANPSHCYVDPRAGAAGCLEEACRNTACVGAVPIGMLDHLQFGSPEDPGVFWTFLESLHGIAGFAREIAVPCVGGKVSFYNETASGAIKPTPLICVVGLAESAPCAAGAPAEGDAVILVGTTRHELGGSAYYERVRGHTGGRCARPRASESLAAARGIVELQHARLARAAHDCSSGGLAVALAEACIAAGAGCSASLDAIPREGWLGAEDMLYSESHSRYVVIARDADEAGRTLDRAGAPHALLGRLGGDSVQFTLNGKTVASADLAGSADAWHGGLEGAVMRG